MRLIISIAVLLFFTTLAHANFSEDKITFHLYPIKGKQVYRVGFKYEKEYFWYKLSDPLSEDDKIVKIIESVYFDTISRNFFIMKRGHLYILPINRPYNLEYHKETDIKPLKSFFDKTDLEKP